MKSKIFTLIALCAFMSFGTIKAQLYMEENFDYPVDTLIKYPVISTQNLQPVNGWSTQTSTNAKNSSWFITTPGLNYPGYFEGASGNALSYVGNTLLTPSVYKSWKHTINQDSTVYISFLINFGANPAPVLSPDFFFGIKNGKFSETNWGACIYASYDNQTMPLGQEINLGIKKSSSGVGDYATSNIAANTTHLFVLKYKLGKLLGTDATTEAAAGYDDQMSLFVNPSTTGGEPSTPTLFDNNAASKDLYRWGATKAFGGAQYVMLKSPATANGNPQFTIDGIRVGLTWADVINLKTGLTSTTANDFRYTIDNDKLLTVFTSNYKNYEVVTLSGQKVLSGTINSQTEKINASNLKSGIYILNLHGQSNASAKVLIH